MAGPLDELEGIRGTVAWLVASVGLALLSVWQLYLKFRKDTRTDQDEVRLSRGAKYADEIYHKLLDSTRARLEAMDRAIEEISADYRAERAARMEAEDRAVMCERDRLIWQQDRNVMLAGIADCERRSQKLEGRVAYLEAQLKRE